MTRETTLHRLEQSVRAVAPAPPAAPVPEFDADQLAREAARAFDEQLARYRRLGELEGPPDPRQPPDDWRVQNARTRPPEDFTFEDMERLGRVDPAAGVARWEEVKAAARTDLDSGWLAARAVERTGGSAWDRACLAAVRRALREACPPRDPGEALLLDQMAQYEVLRLQWVRVLSELSRAPQTYIDLIREGKPGDRNLTAARATLEAVRMVERLQRLYQSALRTLLGLRRSGGAVTVRNTGPVNVALGPQLNVTAPPEPDAVGPMVWAGGQSSPHTEGAE